MKAWSPEPDRSRREARPMPFRQRAVLRSGGTSQRPDLVVTVPVCNEVERIAACIDALSVTLAKRPRAGVLLLVNNSVDGSAQTAFLTLAERGLRGIVVDARLAPRNATAGWARRLAMDAAARWALPEAVLMTTDADGQVAPDWAEANLELLAEGAHLVCGRITPDAAAAQPAASARSDALEKEYADLFVELDARLDPRPHDPWPHHGVASGASLAIRARDYHACGRMPPVPSSEDRAFAALVERHDLCVRHSDAPLVTVSCRLQGRARGGMADAIAARMADPDSFADQRLLPASIAVRRATFRAAMREAWRAGGSVKHIMDQLGVSAAHAARGMSEKTFGAVWAEAEAGAKSLAAARMRPSDLARELPELRRLVARVRTN